MQSESSLTLNLALDNFGEFFQLNGRSILRPRTDFHHVLDKSFAATFVVSDSNISPLQRTLRCPPSRDGGDILSKEYVASLSL